MSAVQPTPGPWTWTLGEMRQDDLYGYVLGPDGYPICRLGIFEIAGPSRDRQEANARLMAAAPTMRDALKKAVLMHPMNSTQEEWQASTMELLAKIEAKAEGSAP